MKFDLAKFVMKTLVAMKNGGEDEYKIMQYALKYYERGVLSDENMSQIEGWFEKESEVSDNETEVIKAH